MGPRWPVSRGQTPARTLTVTVLNPLGLHARPAALLVRTAAGFEARVRIADATNGRGPVSARSLNGVATLGARQGDELVLTATGTEAVEALDALRRLAVDGFGELDEAAAAAGSGPEPDITQDPRRSPGPRAAVGPEAPPSAGTVLAGLPAAPGVACGPAVLLLRARRRLPEGPAADPGAEWSALQEALAASAADIRSVGAGLAGRAAEADAAIFDVHLLFLEDEALLEPAREAIFSRKEPAARAWAEAVGRRGGALGHRRRPVSTREGGGPPRRRRAGPCRSAGRALRGGLPAAHRQHRGSVFAGLVARHRRRGRPQPCRRRRPRSHAGDRRRLRLRRTDVTRRDPRPRARPAGRRRRGRGAARGPGGDAARA